MTVGIPEGLRWVLILASLGILIFVIYGSAKSRMNVRYAVVWITWAVFVLIVAIWPGVARWMANLIGIQSVTNFILVHDGDPVPAELFPVYADEQDGQGYPQAEL